MKVHVLPSGVAVYFNCWRRRWFASRLPLRAWKMTNTCPTSKDIWVEAAVLHPNVPAKRILAQTITHLPEEVAIWMRAAELESDAKNQRKVLRAALQQVPNSKKTRLRVQHQHKQQFTAAAIARALEQVQHSTCKLRE